MSSTSKSPPAERPVPDWPRRWLVLFRLHDDLLFDAPELLRLWARSRADFWQYVMRVEERRAAREAATGGGERAAAVPERGDWRLD